MNANPAAPLPASAPKHPLDINGRTSAPPETSSPVVCSFRLPLTFIAVDRFIEEEKLFEMYGFIDTARAFANGFAVGMLILITGFATYGLGFINAKLEHLDGDESGDPPLLSATLPDGPRHFS